MKENGWTRQVLLPFAITRGALLLVGVLALGLLGSAQHRMPGNLVAHDPAPLPLEVWARWDAEWYLLIAQQGYDVGETLESFSVDYHSGDAAGFFPLYPLSIRALSALGVPPVAAGVVISNLSFLIALSLLRRLLKDTGRSDRSTGLAIWALVAFPTSLFFSAVYSESISLALVLASFLLVQRQRWGWLVLVGFLCGLARPTGWLVALALAWELWEKRAGWKAWLALLSFPSGLAAFGYYCYQLFGDPLIWASRQARWRGSSLWPGKAFVRFFEDSPQLHGAHHSMLEFAMATVFVLALVPILRSGRRSWGIYALLAVMVPLSSTLWSFSRLALGCFPFFVLAGETAGKRDGLGAPLYLSVTLPLAGLLMALFACGWWVG